MVHEDVFSGTDIDVKTMNDLKTRPTDQNVEEFLEKVEHRTRKRDSIELYEMMKEVTKKNQ